MRRAALAACARGACTLGLLAGLAVPAHAQTFAKEPGSRMLERCELAQQLQSGGGPGGLTSEQQAAAQLCLAFVDGFLWGHGWAVWRTARDMYYCPPEDFSTAQAVPALVRYLREHPERLDSDAHVLTFAALSHAFPCVPMPEQ